MADIVTDYGVNYNWKGYKNGHNSFTITFTSGGAAFDLSSYAFTLSIRVPGSPANKLQLTEGSGVTNGGATGILSIALTQTQASTTLPRSDYFYELTFVKDSLTYRVIQGMLTLSSETNPASTATSISADITLAGTDVNVAITIPVVTSEIIETALGYAPESLVRARNLFYDPLFLSSIDQDSDTIQSAKFLWWDEGLTGSGLVKKQIAPIMSEGMTGSVVKIETGASGGGTYFEQYIWFWNFPELFFDQKLSLSILCKSNVLGAGRIDVDFIDRNNQSPGQLVSGTDFTSDVNTVTDEWELLTIENITIPTEGSLTSTYEVPFGLRVRFKALVNNSTVEFSQPMANIGPTVMEFTESPKDFSQYQGLENLARKLFRKTNVEINFLGDSITRNTDATQTANTAAAFATLIDQWIETKFGVTCTKRNNGFDGAADANSFAILDKMTLDHNPDLVVFANGRNVNSASNNGTVAENTLLREAMIRRVRSQSKYTDIINFFPTYKRLESGGLTEANYSQYQKDKQTIENNRYLNNRYRCANIWSADKIRVFGDKGGWWNIFGNNSVAGSEATHPNQMGHRLILDEFKHLIHGSLLNNKYVPYLAVTDIDKIGDSTLVADMEEAVTIYPDQFANGTYDGVTVVMTGTWAADANMVSDGRLAGTTGYLSGVGLGEYPQPKRTSAQGDAIQLSWTGRHFGIWFLKSNNRGTAVVTIDGTPYDFSTNQVLAAVSTNSYPSYCTFFSDNNPNSIALTEGAHTLKIEQKNSGTNAEVSIAMIVLF